MPVSPQPWLYPNFGAPPPMAPAAPAPAQNPFAIDQRKLRDQQLWAMLAGISAGLLGGRGGFGQKLGQGLILGQQQGQNARSNAIDEMLFGLKSRQYEAEEQDRQREREQETEARRLAGTVKPPAGIDPAMWAFAMQYQPEKAVGSTLDQAFKLPDVPSGYRSDAGNLEFIPGGPADPNVAASLRVPQQPPALSEFERIAGAAGLQPGSPEYQEAARKKLGGDQGALFSGTAMNAQAANVVYLYETAKAKGHTPTAEEEYAYKLAKRELEAPRVVTGPDGQQYVIQPQPLPTMSQAPATEQPQPPQPVLGDIGHKMTPEEAAKATALREGVKDIEAATGLLAPSGQIDMDVVIAGQRALGVQGVPFTEGRQARQQMQRGIEAVLRAMTGAAAPESEVTRYMGMFFPAPFDTPEAALQKLQRAKEWTTGMLEMLAVGRPQLTPKAGAPEAGYDPLGILGTQPATGPK